MADYLYRARDGITLDIRMLSIELNGDKELKEHIRQVNGFLKGPLFFRKVSYGLSMLLALRNELESDVDVVHLMWVGTSPIIKMIVRWCEKKNKKVIATILNRHAPVRRYFGLHHLIFHSASARKQYLNAGFLQKYTSIIPPPVDLDDFPEPSEAEPYFVFASGPRTSEQITERGVILLFQVFGRLFKEGFKIQLDFYGRWPEGEQELCALKNIYGAENVNLYHRHRPNLLQKLSKSSGVIVPYVGNRIGDVPLAAIEAFAAGKPVISTLGLGLDEYLQDSEAGLLIEPTPEELYRAVIKVAGDAEKRKQAALKLSQRFDYREFVKEHQLLYQKCTNAND